MEDIDVIVWSVGYTASVGVLSGEDEGYEFLAVDPVQFVQDGERGEDPEAVADL